MGLTELEAGNLLLLMGIGTTLGFTASGWLADRLGLTQVIVTMGITFIITQFVLLLRPPLAVVSIIFILFGFSGAFNIMLLAHVRKIFSLEITGQAISAVNLFGIGGTFIVQWCLGLLIGGYTGDGAGHYPPQAYSLALSLTVIGCILTLAWYIPLARATNRLIIHP